MHPGVRSAKRSAKYSSLRQLQKFLSTGRWCRSYRSSLMRWLFLARRIQCRTRKPRRRMMRLRTKTWRSKSTWLRRKIELLLFEPTRQLLSMASLSRRCRLVCRCPRRSGCRGWCRRRSRRSPRGRSSNLQRWNRCSSSRRGRLGLQARVPIGRRV